MTARRNLVHLVACVALAAVTGCSILSGTNTGTQNARSNLIIHRTTLFRADGETLKPLSKVGRDAFLDPSGYVSWITDIFENNEVVHSYSGYGASVEVHKLGPRDALTLFRKFTFPKGQFVKTTAQSGNVLFVTGIFGKRKFGFVDLRVPVPKFTPLELPEKVKGKTYDDLIVDGETLLAVDDVILPKWLVIYDISAPAEPKPIKIDELMTGINLGVRKGAIGPNHLALFCWSVSRGGSTQSVQIYDRSEGLLKRFRKSFRPRADVLLAWDLWNGDCGGVWSEPEMSFAGDLLLLAGFGDGVGVLDCSAPLDRDTFPAELWHRDPTEEEVRVSDAVALPSQRGVAIWLGRAKSPIIVDKKSLVYRPRKKQAKQANGDQD